MPEPEPEVDLEIGPVLLTDEKTKIEEINAQTKDLEVEANSSTDVLIKNVKDLDEELARLE